MIVTLMVVATLVTIVMMTTSYDSDNDNSGGNERCGIVVGVNDREDGGTNGCDGDSGGGNKKYHCQI